MQSVHLDISVKGTQTAISVKQGDVGRLLELRVTDNGTPYSIPENAILSVWYSGTSGEGNYTEIDNRSAFTVNDNVVVVELIAQMLRCKGGGTMCLILNREDGAQIGFWDIPYYVEPVPGLESQQATQYYTAMSENVAALAEATAQAKAVVEAYQPDTTLTRSGVAADAAAVGDALSGRVTFPYTYEGHNGIDANSVVDGIRCFGVNVANGAYVHGLLDVKRVNGGGFHPSGNRDIIFQEQTNWETGQRAYRRSLDNGQTWNSWEKEGLRAWPVGSVYLSVNSTSPATLFGGTWEQIKDVFLLAAGNRHAAGSVGGEETHLLTAQEMPARINLPYGGSGGTEGVISNESVYTDGAVSGYAAVPTNGGSAHNNMPPYLAVYMWKRTA